MKSWTTIAYLAVALGAVACAAVQPHEAISLEQGASHLGAGWWPADGNAAPAASQAGRTNNRP